MVGFLLGGPVWTLRRCHTLFVCFFSFHFLLQENRNCKTFVSFGSAPYVMGSRPASLQTASSLSLGNVATDFQQLWLLLFTRVEA